MLFQKEFISKMSNYFNSEVLTLKCLDLKNKANSISCLALFTFTNIFHVSNSLACAFFYILPTFSVGIRLGAAAPQGKSPSQAISSTAATPGALWKSNVLCLELTPHLFSHGVFGASFVLGMRNAGTHTFGSVASPLG